MLNQHNGKRALKAGFKSVMSMVIGLTQDGQSQLFLNYIKGYTYERETNKCLK